jgi:integration host factor subunit alpha
VRNITKNSIINHLHEEIGISKKLLGDVVTSVFENIIDLSINDSNIKIKNFGSFHISKKPQRPGNLIATNQRIDIEERLVLKFLPSRSLKERINKIV